ncbi:hypothetical protein [Pseudomonas sp.]|uniref:hypothetical protein n=1 Tax=Pseudomonas sp. TaxID=306 RepID=UPI003FD8D05A
MFNNLFLYSSIFLAITTASLSGFLVHENGLLAVAEHSLKEQANVVLALQNSLNLKDLSCKKDVQSAMEVEAQKINLRLKMDAVTEQIASLSSGLKQEAVVSNIATPVKQTTKVVIANAASVKSNVLTGSELLSPTLVSLLNKSFCNAEPSDSQCVSK